MFERDFIKRMVEQLADFVARIGRLKDEGQHDEALDEIDDALARLVPARHDLVARLDATSAAKMMRDRDTVKAYARLVATQADVLASSGDRDRATVKRARAIALWEEARKLTTDVDDELEGWLRDARRLAANDDDG